LEAVVIDWLARGALILSGVVAGWFVSKDSPNFSLVQGMAALVVIALIVAVLAFWPSRWTRRLNRQDEAK
jgi:hypothetical protein